MGKGFLAPHANILAMKRLERMIPRQHAKSDREREFDRQNREAAERVLADKRNEGSGLWEWAEAVMRAGKEE